jgi:riboflavin kinase/FMN adenylyltransferase
MIIHYGYENLAFTRPVVTSGIFDGVHRGHRALLDNLARRAEETGGEAVVITFSPHPRLVLYEGSRKPVFLSTPDEKIRLIEACRADHLIIIDFTPEFSRMSADEFFRKILVEKISASYFIIGHDHHFGRGAEGSFEMIKHFAGPSGLRIEQVPGLRQDNIVISSSLIRGLLLDGRLEEANSLLGYSYTLGGRVVEGRKIGRSMGFPTANIVPVDEYKLIPGEGVYAVEVRLGSVTHRGMLSIGTNPTVNRKAKTISIEVHIFNFGDNIYGMDIDVTFHYRLRNNVRFADTNQLARQMELDREKALKLLP